MSDPARLRPYKKSLDYSYAFGAFAVHELLAARPKQTRAVYIHSAYDDGGRLSALCMEYRIPVVINDKAFARVAQKDNSLVFAVFGKYADDLADGAPHVALVNPQDMGNLGSIARSAAAFGVPDMAVVSPAADIFDPKAVRASMGAVFRIRARYFKTFGDYLAAHPERNAYAFMTDGARDLTATPPPAPGSRFTLVYGNEAAGLPPAFKSMCKAVRIPQSTAADSLNLSVAVGIGLFWAAGGMYNSGTKC